MWDIKIHNKKATHGQDKTAELESWSAKLNLQDGDREVEMVGGKTLDPWRHW